MPTVGKSSISSAIRAAIAASIDMVYRLRALARGFGIEKTKPDTNAEILLNPV